MPRRISNPTTENQVDPTTGDRWSTTREGWKAALAASAGAPQVENLTITATDVISNLSQTPLAGGAIELVLEGESHFSTDLTPSFVVTGQAITWNPANAGSHVYPADELIARYFV